MIEKPVPVYAHFKLVLSEAREKWFHMQNNVGEHQFT